MIYCLFATRHLEVEPEVLDAELPPVDVVVLHLQGYIRRRRNTYAREHVDLVQSHPLLLDGNVGEVNKQVVHLTSAVVILHRAKPGGVSVLQLQLLLPRAHRQKPSLKR